MSAEWTEEDWGRWDPDPPCAHLLALRNALASLQMAVWSEHGVEPSGWVNVRCTHCMKTYEICLHDDRDPLTVRHK